MEPDQQPIPEKRKSKRVSFFGTTHSNLFLISAVKEGEKLARVFVIRVRKKRNLKISIVYDRIEFNMLFAEDLKRKIVFLNKRGGFTIDDILKPGIQLAYDTYSGGTAVLEIKSVLEGPLSVSSGTLTKFVLPDEVRKRVDQLTEQMQQKGGKTFTTAGTVPGTPVEETDVKTQWKKLAKREWIVTDEKPDGETREFLLVPSDTKPYSLKIRVVVGADTLFYEDQTELPSVFREIISVMYYDAKTGIMHENLLEDIPARGFNKGRKKAKSVLIPNMILRCALGPDEKRKDHQFKLIGPLSFQTKIYGDEARDSAQRITDPGVENLYKQHTPESMHPPPN